MAIQKGSSSVTTQNLIKSIYSSALDIRRDINVRAINTINPNITEVASDFNERRIQSNQDLITRGTNLINSREYQYVKNLFNSNPTALSQKNQNILSTWNKLEEQTKSLLAGQPIQYVASRTKALNEAQTNALLNTSFENQHKGIVAIQRAVEKGITSVSGAEAYATNVHGISIENVPNKEYIQRLIDSKGSVKSFLSNDTNIRKEMTGAILDADKVLKAEGGGTGTNKAISAGLLGLAIGKAGEYGATVGRSGVLETAGFIKNTIGNGYDYGSPYANVIQQQSNIRQSTIGLVTSAIGAGIGSLGGPPGMFIGGTIGSQVGNVASAIGGSKDTLQAQAIAEYNQQAMMMQTLYNTRVDLKKMMGGYGEYQQNTGIANALDVMTPTRLMVAKGAISVNNQLSESWVNSTANEAVASNMSYAQSENYGYNKAIISRYFGGSKLNLGGMARNANVDVGDLAQRTLDYVPFTHGNIQSASDMAQRSFSQSNSFTQRQLEYGSEGYISKYTRNMLDSSIFHMSYDELMSGSKAGNAKLREIDRIASNKKNPLSLMYGATADISHLNPGYTPYYGAESASTTKLFPLNLTNSQESANVMTTGARVKSFFNKTNQDDVDKSLADFERGLSDTTVTLRDFQDTLNDLKEYKVDVPSLGQALRNHFSNSGKTTSN